MGNPEGRIKQSSYFPRRHSVLCVLCGSAVPAPSHPQIVVSTRSSSIRFLMRTDKPWFLALIGLLLGGCAHEHFMKGRGDVGRFIVQQVVVRCALSVPTNDLPVISGRWRYSEDQEGVVIRMSREQYPAIESLLRQTFGAPRFGPVDTKDGSGKLGMYRLTPKGGVIQFGYDAQRTQVIVIRPLTQKEFGEGFQKAMQDDRFWKNWSK